MLLTSPQCGLKAAYFLFVQHRVFPVRGPSQVFAQAREIEELRGTGRKKNMPCNDLMHEVRTPTLGAAPQAVLQSGRRLGLL